MKRRIVLSVTLVLFIAAIALGVLALGVSEAGTSTNLFLRIGFFSTVALVIPFALVGLVLDEPDSEED